MAYNEIIWNGEDGLSWKALVGIEKGIPCINELSYQRAGTWVKLAGPLYPQFEVSTGPRRMDKSRGHDFENRWNAYGDCPLIDPAEVEIAVASFAATRCEVTKEGALTVVNFDGLDMGYFKGGVRFSFYEGSNLIRVEALAANDKQDSLAYIYRAALRGFSPGKLYYRGLRRNFVSELPRGKSGMEKYIRVYARNRVLAMEQAEGSVAVFPPPHKFFFPRQLEINLGFNYYRREEADNTIALGVRHNEKNGYYETCPNQRCWPCYNARPGTVQKMAAYFAVSAGNVNHCRELVMRYTHNDRFPDIPGYKKMANHFHMAFREFWLQDNEKEQDWEFLFKEMGVDIAYLNDFHGGDGHPEDNGPRRLQDLHEYFAACRSRSTSNFLVVAGEEPNDQIDGHWNVFFPKPVYFSRGRDPGQPFVEQTKYGPYYHLGSGEDITALLKAEKGLMLLPHPRTKASEGCPDAYRDEAFFRDPTFIGIGFRYMPADNSVDRLIDGRNESTWNDINNWNDHPKYIMGEVDTYQKNIEYDPYGDFNINYVKLDTIPAPDNYAPITEAIRAGKVFVSTGEVIIPVCEIRDGFADAELSWTFPMNFAELVYSDGNKVDRAIVPLTDTTPFGTKKLHIEFPRGMKWARFAAWDSAGNGAFHQPVFL
ncbi:hypothetical protein AGMMS50255_3010 [Spirochaetia bacterium]|nr:hypothetical protein AGMMS50255_3010 [Spirochaetia bacterium]